MVIKNRMGTMCYSRVRPNPRARDFSPPIIRCKIKRPANQTLSSSSAAFAHTSLRIRMYLPMCARTNLFYPQPSACTMKFQFAFLATQSTVPCHIFLYYVHSNTVYCSQTKYDNMHVQNNCTLNIM